MILNLLLQFMSPSVDGFHNMASTQMGLSNMKYQHFSWYVKNTVSQTCLFGKTAGL
jgi:hypothetical protein